MWVCTKAFHVPKHGNAQAEYEDAFFPANGFHFGISGFRCAVADGATESAFSGIWARLLVRGFGRRRLRLRKLQRSWQRSVKRGKLPWYLQAKLPKGAHAAFVGLSIRDGVDQSPPGGSWRALAVGDSCLFHVRGSKLLAFGPVQKSEDFGNRPYLLSTNSHTSIRRHAEYVAVLGGTWQSHDSFYLATDALAQWMLSEHEAGRSPWTVLRDLGNNGQEAAFQSFVAELRTSRRLNNDDTTLLGVEVV